MQIRYVHNIRQMKPSSKPHFFANAISSGTNICYNGYDRYNYAATTERRNASLSRFPTQGNSAIASVIRL